MYQGRDLLRNVVSTPNSSLNLDCDAHLPQVNSASRPAFYLDFVLHTAFAVGLRSILGIGLSVLLSSLTWAATQACTIQLDKGSEIDFGQFSSQEHYQLKERIPVTIQCSKSKTLYFRLQDNKRLSDKDGELVFQAQYFALTAEPNESNAGTLVGYYSIAPGPWGNSKEGYVKVINSEGQSVSSSNPVSLLSGALLKSGEKYSFRDLNNKKFKAQALIGEFEVHVAKLMITEGEIHGSFSLELIYG